MTKHNLINGSVTMWSTRPTFPGPKVQELKLSVECHPDGRWSVAPEDFGTDGEVVIDDIDAGPLGKAKLTVTLAETARGRLDLATRAMHVDATFDFFMLLRSSELALRLDGGSYTVTPPGATAAGAVWDATTGALRLAGRAVFDAGWLGGDECLVLMEGVLDPRPWS